MGLIDTAVAYDGLPISSGGAHGLGRISARDAFRAWHGFLETCSEASATTCFFEFPSTPELEVEPALVRRIREAFPQEGTGRAIAVPRDRFDDAIALFESLEPLPVDRWGMAPVWLWFTADFRLRRPHSGELWPGQEPARFGHFVTPGGVRLGASSGRLILQARRSIGLSLSIPAATDSDLVELIPWLQESLPMRLSAKHWTRWSLTKSGRSYRGAKIAP